MGWRVVGERLSFSLDPLSGPVQWPEHRVGFACSFFSYLTWYIALGGLYIKSNIFIQALIGGFGVYCFDTM